MSKINEQSIEDVLNKLITDNSSIKPLIDAILRFYHINGQLWSFNSESSVLRNRFTFLTSTYEFKGKKACDELDYKLKLEYIIDAMEPASSKKIKRFDFGTSIIFQPSNNDLHCVDLEPSSTYAIECSVKDWNYDINSELSLEIEDFRILSIKAGKVSFTGEDECDYDRDFMYTYYIKNDELSNTYVEVEHNGKLIGIIDFNEFLDALNNRKYNKFLLCDFSTFSKNVNNQTR